jgi:anti-sigma B factor antagonist
MKTTIHTSEGKALVNFEGEMDSHIIGQVAMDMAPLFELKDTDITLDCSKLEYISSNGFRLFQILISAARSNRSTLYIQGLSPDLMDVFKASGFDKCFIFK